MKKLLTTLAALLVVALPLTAQIPQITYTAQAGVSLFSSTVATATATSGIIRLPNYTGVGTLTVTEAGITGSPSGCTIAFYYQGNNSSTKTAQVASTAFTPATGVQMFTVVPSVQNGDNLVAVYACSSTYPTAGTLTASFSPLGSTVSADPCFTGQKSSVAIAISTATTTQLVALASGKKVYVCSFSATTPASSSLVFEYGTGSACGTGTTALTGAYGASSSITSGAADATQFSAPAGNALCALTTGTGAQGVLSYVQQN